MENEADMRWGRFLTESTKVHRKNAHRNCADGNTLNAIGAKCRREKRREEPFVSLLPFESLCEIFLPYCPRIVQDFFAESC